MLTDTKLRNLKPKSKLYKVSDRDGMYVTVSPTGTVTFRYDYRLNGRRETLTIGRYGPTGISLAMAREKLFDAKRMVALGKSPSLEKQRAKRRLNAAKNFGETLTKWLAGARMADSTRAMRKSIIDRDILPVFENRLLTEITPDDLRALCAKVKARGAPATAVHIRDIVKQVYAFAILHGEKVENPADDVKASSIATFVPKDRALSPTEIRLAFHQLESIAAYPTIKLALRLVLLTLVRKSELIEATWSEVDFENATWTISRERMKGRNPHVVYLSRQALDIFVALHTCAAGSRYVLPSRYDIYRCMSHATLNRITQLIASRAKDAGLPLEPFTVHDLRRTGSTLLNEVGFNGDWIEKCLAHEDVCEFASRSLAQQLAHGVCGCSLPRCGSTALHKI
ncbi:tyrosine-type recombinase/integrase [Pseudomonas sp.]|uniref:tyrosine-type recombinase/integrase n=1 Tax=Pseudomonas sp. TaxID=306 RepID=UPI003A96AB39